jgi:hypothetical protein
MRMNPIEKLFVNSQHRGVRAAQQDVEGKLAHLDEQYPELWRTELWRQL